MKHSKPKAQAAKPRFVPTVKPFSIYNTASRSVEVFTPIVERQVGLYTCGPTVYDYAHIGNLRTYIFEDILHRALIYDGFKVKHVMNVTDVGHLTSDADQGEDKMEKGATRQGRTVWEIAEYYQQQFFNDLQQLNIVSPDIIARATDEIPAQQELISTLIDKGFAYQTSQAVYFEVTKFPAYWEFSGQKLADKEVGVRSEVRQDQDKRNPADFALWLFTVGDHEHHVMHWASPWGEGFPGWHIECSAISMKYLGEEFDIHTGGVDHIGTHHPNEIAQSEAATGKKFAHYWMHGEFLNTNGAKMAKSKENFDRLQTITDKGFKAVDYRYFCLTAHYRTTLEFDWERLQEAATTLRNLKREILQWDEVTNVDTAFESYFHSAINQDLDMPTALTVLWEMVGSDIKSGSKRATYNKFEQVLGLGLRDYHGYPLNEKEKDLIKQRQTARNNKNWVKADEIRDRLQQAGIEIDDTGKGAKAIKL